MYKNLNLKKHYYFRVVFLIVSIFTIISCRKDDESDSNNPTVEKSIKAYTNQSTNQSTVFQSNAIFVKSDINNQFVSYSETDGTLTLNNNEALNIIKTGDVIYSLPTKDFPDGYAFKIISSKTGKISSSGRTTTGSTITYETKPASMTEVFKEYICSSPSTIETDVTKTAAYDFLTDQQAGSYLLNSTPFGAVSSLVPNFEMKNILDTYKTKHFANPKQYTRFTKLNIGSDKTTFNYIVYDLDGNYGTANDQVVLEMELTYQLKDTKIDIHNTKFNLQGNHKWSSQATLKYEYDKDWTDQEKENFKNKFKGEVVGKKYNVLSIPLTLPNATDLLLKPSLDIFYELQLDISGNVEVTAGVTEYEYKFNINNQNQQSFSLVNAGKYDSTIKIGADLNFGMRFGIGVTAEIPAFKLFDVKSLSKKSYAGIYADFGANANVKASVTNDTNDKTCFNFKTNYTADAGFYLEYKIYFVSDMTLKDKIPIYTSPSYSGSLADYEECIPKSWLPNPPSLIDSFNNQYKTLNLNGKFWSAENWKGTYNASQVFGDDLIFNQYNSSFGDYLDGKSIRDNNPFLKLPNNWDLPTKEDFDNLLSVLGASAFQTLTKQAGFNAKPYGYIYFQGYFGGAHPFYPDFNTKAIYASKSTFVNFQTTRTYLYCLVVNFSTQTVSVEPYEIDFYSPSGYGSINSYFNVRLIKD